MEVKIGHFAVTDMLTPTECLRQAIEAEKIGFDALWVEHHFTAMPGSPQCSFPWTVMSSTVQATERVPFMTIVAAPIMRYPAPSSHRRLPPWGRCTRGRGDRRGCGRTSERDGPPRRRVRVERHAA
ncbi:MAG: LLM class flavin-dependent oxidoreductase [Halobacteriota archaeon]